MKLNNQKYFESVGSSKCVSFEHFKEKKVTIQSNLIRKLKDDMASLKMELIQKNSHLDELTNPAAIEGNEEDLG